MFRAIQNSVNRPPATGKARVVKNMMGVVVLLIVFYVFQTIQVQKMGDALDGLLGNAVQSTASNTKSLTDTLTALEKKFPKTVDFVNDPAFAEAPLSDRTAADISVQLKTAKDDTEFSTQGILLYPVFKYIIPSAQPTVDNHNQKVDQFFHGDTYTKYADVDRKINDITSAIAYCNGTVTDKNSAGWVGQDKPSTQQKADQSKLIQAAADRTLCSDKAAFKAQYPVAATNK